MAPHMYNSMKYDYIPYKGSIGNSTRRYLPYQETITGKNMNSGRLYKGTIQPPLFARKEKKTPIKRHKARVPSRQRASRPAKEVQEKKSTSTAREEAPLRTRSKPKNTDSLYKGNIKWQAQQKPYKEYQYKPYKGTIEVFSRPYKEYRLPDDYYGFRRKRNKVHPLRHIPRNQYQSAVEREVELKKNRYVPGYALYQSYDRHVVDNTLRYKPEYVSAKQEDKQIIRKESKYTPTYAGITHREKEIMHQSPYQLQTANIITDDRTIYEPQDTCSSKSPEIKYVTESRAPVYAPIFVAMHTEEKTVEGPRKPSPTDVYLRQSPVVYDPLRENPSKINPMTSSVPVAVASHNSNSQTREKNPEKESKKETIGHTEKQENSVGQRKWSPKKENPVVVVQHSSKDIDKRKKLEQSQLRNPQAGVPKANKNKEPIVVSAPPAAATNKRKPSEIQRRASPLADPISLFPPPSPEPLLSGRQGNSPRRVSPDAMRHEPMYKPKPEPMFPPLIPVSAQDYINSRPYPEPKVLSKNGNGNPLIPVPMIIPFNDGKNPYFSFSPPVFGDKFYDPPSPRSDYTPRHTGIPSYTAVGSILRSMQVYNY